jgi:hypothetical protein
MQKSPEGRCVHGIFVGVAQDNHGIIPAQFQCHALSVPSCLFCRFPPNSRRDRPGKVVAKILKATPD